VKPPITIAVLFEVCNGVRRNAGLERRQRRDGNAVSGMERRQRRQHRESTGSYRPIAGPNFKRSLVRSETSKIGLFRRGRKNGANHFAALPASLALSALSALAAFQLGADGDPNWQLGSKAFIVSCGTS